MTAKKVLLLGEIGVGKTSLVRRLVLDELPTDYRATMGVDLYRYVIDGVGPMAEQSLEIVVWDLDGNYGQSIFQHVYSKGASAALIIGDCSRRSTLDHMGKLAEGFISAMPSRPFAFVVNKVDLIGDAAPDLLPPALAGSRQPIVWTSAKTALNVLTAFRQAADAIIRREN